MAADGEESPNPVPPSPPLSLPSYPEMIREALGALGNVNGSNKTAISGYIKGKYGASLPPAHNSFLAEHLARMKDSRELVFSRNNYLLPDDVEEEPSEPGPADTLSPSPPRGQHPEPEDPVSEAPDGLFSPASLVAAGGDGVPAPAPVAAADAVAVPVKRGRGRPPKPKDPVVEDPDAAPIIPADANAVPVKRGRGRPPKPKDPTISAPVAAPVVAAGANVMPVKRGRGRPPKPKDPVAEAVAVATSGMPRPRGRPPKKAKVAQEARIAAPAPASGGAADTKAVPVKRGRGRPPKVRPPVNG